MIEENIVNNSVDSVDIFCGPSADCFNCDNASVCYPNGLTLFSEDVEK